MKIKYILSLLVLISTFIACQDDDLSSVIDESAKPTVSATLASSSISEDGSPTAIITIAFDKPIKTTTTFMATQVGGDADDSDYSVGLAVVPAFATSATMEITINDDILIEGTETLDLQITATGIPDIYEVVGTPTVSLSIENSVSDDFVFKMEWGDTYLDSDGDEHSFCDYDFDIEIYDTAGDVVAASYNDCPEEIRLSPGDLADGDYWLAPTFWTLAGAVPPASVTDFPAMLIFSKPGVAFANIDLTGMWNSVDGGVVQSNPDATLFRYIITISGSTYTIRNSDTGAVVFQG